MIKKNKLKIILIITIIVLFVFMFFGVGLVFLGGSNKTSAGIYEHYYYVKGYCKTSATSSTAKEGSYKGENGTTYNPGKVEVKFSDASLDNDTWVNSWNCYDGSANASDSKAKGYAKMDSGAWGTPHYRYKVEIKATANAGFGVVGVYTQSTNTSGNSPSYTSSKTGVTTTNSTSSTKSISGISGEVSGGAVGGSTRNDTYYAIFNPISYSVKFNYNDGSGGSTSLSTTYGDYYNMPSNPKRTGYTFVGWFNTDSSTGGTEYTSGKIKGTGTNELWARWKANSYTVKFNGNGSTSGSMSNQSFTYGTAQKLTTNTFKKTGYTFSGWATSSTGGVSYSDGQSVSNLTSISGGTVTLYAVWTPNIYTISLNKQSGSNGTSTIYLKYNTGWYSNNTGTTSISAITKPTRSGYIFQGYYTDTEGKGTQIINSNGNFVSGKLTYTTANDTLYAYWTPISYSINYELNGGAFGGNSPTNNTQYNTAINVPNPSKEGYTFAGWSGGTNFNSSTAQSGSESDSMSSWSGGLTKNTYFKNLTPNNGVTVTLVANYTANSYTVTFNPNGGTVSQTTKSVTYDSTYGTLPTPTRTGYSFAGWKLNGTTITSATQVKTASNHTLVAQWTANSYTLKYNANGGTVNPTTKTVTFDTAYGTLPTPTRAGYIFIGWYTTKDGGSQVTSATKMTTEGAEIFAHWQDTWANHAEAPSLRVPSNPNNASNPYIIDTPKKLAWLAMKAQEKHFSAYFEQTANIDLSGNIWLPIGGTYYFGGYYNGKGYTIEGLETAETIEGVSNSTSVNSYVGLFGNTDGAKLNNIYIKGADIKGHTNVGGIVGYASGSTVLTSCAFSGTISAQANSGALIGNSVSGVQITDCIVFSANVDKLNSGSATTTSTIYVLNGKKGYSSGEFENWVYVSGMSFPVPKGLSWLAQGGEQATIDDIKNWANS